MAKRKTVQDVPKKNNTDVDSAKKNFNDDEEGYLPDDFNEDDEPIFYDDEQE